MWNLVWTLPIVVMGTVLLVAISSERTRTEIRKYLSASDDEPFSIVAVSQAFDPDCAIIWDTQIPALEKVINAGRRGLPLKRLFLWYSDSARHYPELYDGSSCGRWMEFLEREGLVARKGRNICITTDGQRFLECRIVAEALIPA